MKYGSSAASTRQRLLQYSDFLADKGVAVDFTPLLTDDYILALSGGKKVSILSIVFRYLSRMKQLFWYRDYDILWVHCEVFPFLPGFFECLAFLSGKPVMYDYDDAIFHNYDKHRNFLIRMLLGQKLAPLMRHATACCCGNEYLYDYASLYCKNSIIIPTVVDIEKYISAEHSNKNDERIVVGWIGSPSTWAYVEPYLPLLKEEMVCRNMILRVIGAGANIEHITGIEFIDWSEETEVTDIQNMDIGIMPLPDEPWARGKCGYKLIQYMACGLPVIASPVGVNSQIVEDGVNGFLASTEHEWKEAIGRLAADKELRTRMGRRGREKVVREYSLQVQAPRLARLIKEVVNST